MSTEGDLRREIVRVCARLYERGLIAGQDGNVSARFGDSLLVTPAGLSKVDVTADAIVRLTLAGEPAGGASDPALRPSSEVGMHLRIYARRPDVAAVVHAHPPVATGFGVAGEDFLAGVLPEIILLMGGVPLGPYATPGTPAVGDALEPFLERYDAFLLANHGATTVGPSLTVAHQRMESLEHAARILLTARTLGWVNELSAAQMNELTAARAASRGGSPGSARGEADPGARGGDGGRSA